MKINSKKSSGDKNIKNISIMYEKNNAMVLKYFYEKNNAMVLKYFHLEHS
jgi:hypothetical protein